MRVCFVGRGGLEKMTGAQTEAATSGAKENVGVGSGVTLFSFQDEEVSYEKELKGETDRFERAAAASKAGKTVLVCGFITNARGHKRKSALVAENGKLLGVSDRIHSVDGDCASGATLRVYETGAGRMGVVVAEDIAFPDVIKTLSLCGSDFIVCTYGKLQGIETALVRAYAYCFGIPIYLCGKGYAMLAEPSGEIAFASPQSPVYIEYKNVAEYRLIETRQKGVRQMKNAGD